MANTYNLIATEPVRMPKGSYRGELHTEDGKYVANIYLVDHRVTVGRPRPFGKGELTEILPGTFDPKSFKRAGGSRISASQRVQYWTMEAA